MVISLVQGSGMGDIFSESNWIMENLRPISGPIKEFYHQNLQDMIIIKGNQADKKCSTLSNIFRKEVPPSLMKFLEDCSHVEPATSWNFCGRFEFKEPYQTTDWLLGPPTKGKPNACSGNLFLICQSKVLN